MGADFLLITSMNLNRGVRIENYSVYSDSDLIRQYRALCDEVFEVGATIDDLDEAGHLTSMAYRNLMGGR